MADSATPSLRILVVDDDPDTTAIMAKHLKQEQHHVSTAPDVQRAQELAAMEKFDLLISDIGLGTESGLELMRTLKAAYQIRGIAVSGWDGDADHEAVMQAGFSARIVKPILFSKLMQAIDEVMGR